MSTSTIDFNGAETQDAALALIPANTLLKVRITIRPGGAGPEGWLTQSKTSEAMYLNTEAVVVEGPQARRRIYTRIGVKGRGANERGEDIYANRGRALIRGILESARGTRTDDQSERAWAARTIRGFGDLNGLEFVAKVGIDRDRKNPSDEGRNVIAAAIGAEHADYGRLMGAAPAAVPAAPAATPAFASAGSQPGPAQPAAGNAPFWAR
ncbi:MAG: hypothetical protein K2Y40_12225 [Reyranella sp.]|nr:hypothetical protein [Reyranella sp.]